MIIKLNKIDNQTAELNIELSKSEWKKEYLKARNLINANLHNVNKGIENSFIRGKKLTRDEEVLKMAVENILYAKIEEAKVKYNLDIINHPDYEILNSNSEGVKLSVICINKPKISLGVYKDLSIEREHVEVLASEVDVELDKHRESDGEIPLIEILPYKYFKDIEELKESTKNKLLKEKEYIEKRIYIGLLMEKIINDSYIDIPESLIRLEASKMHKVFLERLDRLANINSNKVNELKESWESVTIENRKSNESQALANDVFINTLVKQTELNDNFVDKYRDKATKVSKVRLVLDKIAEVEGVETKTYSKERLAFFEDEAIYTRDVNVLEYLIKNNSNYRK